MKLIKLFEKIGNLPMHISNQYYIYCKDKDGNFVKAKAVINSKEKRMEIVEEQVK